MRAQAGAIASPGVGVTVWRVSNARVIVHEDKAHLAEAAAARIADVLAGTDGDRVTLGLAGGSTPAETYRRLRSASVDWGRVDAWLSDERWVAHDHLDCNGRMAAELLMDHVEARFFRPRWALWLTPADSAAHYEADLRTIHPDGRASLILLGMGPDGHTASLFPGTSALEAPPHRWFVANHVPQIDRDRLTATHAFLRRARDVFFLVAGEDKAPALRQVLEPRDDEDALPAAGVMAGDAEVTWFVDEAAASQLSATVTDA